MPTWYPWATLGRCARPAPCSDMVADGPDSVAISTWNGPWPKPLDTVFGLLVRNPISYVPVVIGICQLMVLKQLISWPKCSTRDSAPPSYVSFSLGSCGWSHVVMICNLQLTLIRKWTISNFRMFCANYSIWLELYVKCSQYAKNCINVSLNNVSIIWIL